MTSAATLSTMPVELTEHIFSFFDPAMREDRRALSSLSQTNHDYRHLAQKLLFHTVIIKRPFITQQKENRFKRLSFAKMFYELIAGGDDSSNDNPQNVSPKPHHIASYVKRLEIRDDRTMAFYRASESWIITDNSAIYLAPLIHPASSALHHDNEKAISNPEDPEEHNASTHTLGHGTLQSHRLLPNLETVCIIGNLRGQPLAWSDFRDDMKDALAGRLATGTLRGLELEHVRMVPFDLLRGSVNLEVLRLKGVVFSPSLDASPEGNKAGCASKLKDLDVELLSPYYSPRESFFGWIARQKDVFDLSALTKLSIRTVGCFAYESAGGATVEAPPSSMIGMEEIAYIVEKAKNSLRVLRIDDPRLDRWLAQNPPFHKPCDIFEWAPYLTNISFGFCSPRTVNDESDSQLLRRISDMIGEFEGLKREKPLEVELRFTFGEFIVLKWVVNAWEELEQKIRLVQSGPKPAVHIHITIAEGLAR
ncbi:hypothetical protein BJ165DRAFT_7499 [Panaeolus papilionaceus]|nr:hypothetical protein BJ165DRAFT_7499 [Panaeolus papilionaceus]